MWLHDWRYTTLTAFVIGYDHGCGRVLGNDPKTGFQAWVSRRFIGHANPIGWEFLIASHDLPGFPQQLRATKDLTAEQDEKARRDLLMLLDEYLAEIEGESAD
jgi:hypothetical protein